MNQRIIDRSYVGEVLQRIYSSELGLHLTLFAEGGYFYITHGNKKSPLQGTSIEEAVTHFASTVAIEFPNSSFANWWRMSFQSDRPKGER